MSSSFARREIGVSLTRTGSSSIRSPQPMEGLIGQGQKGSSHAMSSMPGDHGPRLFSRFGQRRRALDARVALPDLRRGSRFFDFESPSSSTSPCLVSEEGQTIDSSTRKPPSCRTRIRKNSQAETSLTSSFLQAPFVFPDFPANLLRCSHSEDRYDAPLVALR